MRTPKLKSRRLLGATLALTLLASLVGPAAAQSYEYDWARGLMEDFRYDDMAAEIFERLSKRPDNEQKMLGLLGLAKLLRKQAQTTEEVAERARLNEEALTRLREVAKNLKKGTVQYFETKFELAATLQDIASEDIDLMNEGRVPADKLADYAKRNDNRLSEANFIYEEAASGLSDVNRNKEPQLWLMGRQAVLAKAVLLLRKAENIGTDPAKLRSPQRVDYLTTAVSQLDDFILEHEGELIGQYAMLWYGRVKSAMLESQEGNVTASDVEESFQYIYDTLIFEPGAPQSWQELAQKACWWKFQFQNRQGRTSQCIEAGDKLRQDWKKYKYEFNVFGRLALIELGEAYHTEGRSGEALELAGFVSEQGGFAGQQADKLMSVIIETALNKDTFAADVLAAGANGAYVASFKNPAKHFETIQLYQMVLQNLEKIEDVDRKNELGRLAWYRIGRAFDQIGRKLDAALAFENGYRKFNNEHIVEERDLNKRMSQRWRGVLMDLSRSAPGSAYLRQLLTDATNHLIADPPKGAVAGVAGLQWQKAENLRRGDKFLEAKKEYEALSKDPSEYQERAMVKLAVVNSSLVRAKKDATSADWVEAAKLFENYIDYARNKSENDEERLKAREAAVLEARFEISQCYDEAAKATENQAEQRRYCEKVVEATEGLTSQTRDSNLKQHARANRFFALIGLDRLDDAERVFDEMLKEDASHKVVPAVALAMGKRLKDRYEKMPTDTVEQEQARNDVMARAGRAYKLWLLDRRPNKLGYWAMVNKMFYDRGDWETSFELLDLAVRKFEGRKGTKEKEIAYLKRHRAKCLLERAKVAYNDGKKEEADELFGVAAEEYKRIVGPKDKAPSSVLEEAAEIFGGFVVGPDRHGEYIHYPGTAEFERAANIWYKLERKLKAKEPKGEAERRELADKRERARFNKMVMYWKAGVQDTSGKKVKQVARALDAMFTKSPQPGGPNWFRKYQWLRSQVR